MKNNTSKPITDPTLDLALAIFGLTSTQFESLVNCLKCSSRVKKTFLVYLNQYYFQCRKCPFRTNLYKPSNESPTYV